MVMRSRPGKWLGGGGGFLDRVGGHSVKYNGSLPARHGFVYHLHRGVLNAIETTLRGAAMIARVFGLALLGLAVAAFSVGTAGDKDKDAKKDVVKDVVKDKDVKKDKDASKDKIEKKEKKDKEKKEPPKVDLKSVAG